MRTPREVVELYNNALWNEQRHELAGELIGESIVRHGIGEVRTLTHAEACQRVVDTWASVQRLEFVLVQVFAEGELVSVVYECHVTPKDGPENVTSSMEVFRVVEGRIREVWNAAYTPGRWQ